MKSFSSYCFARAIIFSTENREELRLPQALFLGLVLPQLLGLAQQLNLQRRKLKVKSALETVTDFLQSYSSALVCGLLLVLILVPNVKFLRSEGGYLIRKLFYAVCVPFAVLYALVFV